MKKEYPRGADVIFESVGGVIFEQCVKVLATKGRLVIIGAVSNYAVAVKKGEAMNEFHWDTVKTSTLLGKSLTVTGFFLNHYFADFPETMKLLTDLFVAGIIKRLTGR